MAPLTLYATPPSNPSQTVRLMLEHKGIEHRVVWLLPGLHPQLVRLRGFRGRTVPAVKVDGRKVQNSRAIARLLEELQPDPPLFPSDPERRLTVEEAERWGEDFQNVPRVIYRWMGAHHQSLRKAIALDVGMPLPGFAAATNAPVAKRLAKQSGGEAGARAAIETLPADLDHIDGLIADGVIGGEERNAADFQIATSVRVLEEMEDTRPFVDGRPCSAWACAILPDSPAHAPALLPREWISGAKPASS
jgi:glutathione S-transferase